MHRRHRGRRREPEVVVTVPVDRHLVVEVLRDLADEERRRLRRRDPERVHDDDLCCAGVGRALVRRADEPEVGPRRVDAEERYADPVLHRERDRGADPLEHRLARDPERGQLPVRDRALDHGRGEPELDESIDVGRDGAENPQISAPSPASRMREIALASSSETRGKPCLDPIDARVVQGAGDRQLVLRERTTPTVCSPSRSVVS